MDAPEVVSGPQRSLSYMLRRQSKLQIPPVAHSSPVRSGRGSLDEISMPRGEDEKETTPILPQQAEKPRWAWRRHRVVLILSVVIVILIATIGGGVGGSLAENARRAPITTPMVVMMPTTVTMTMTMTMSPSPTPTPSAQDQVTMSEGAIRVPTQGVIDFDCSRITMNRQVITIGTSMWGFDVSCMMDFSAGPALNIAGMTAYAFEDCIKACAMLNNFQRNNTCVGVFFNANLTTSLPATGGNCFLKSYLPQMTAQMDLAAAAALVMAPQFS